MIISHSVIYYKLTILEIGFSLIEFYSHSEMAMMKQRQNTLAYPTVISRAVMQVEEDIQALITQVEHTLKGNI